MRCLSTILNPNFSAVCAVCAGLCLTTYASAQRSQICGSESRQVLSAKGRATTDDGETLFIPVIFHVVYNNEEQNIPDSRIYSQLEVINEDFGKKNADTTNTIEVFKNVVGNPNIQFYLADDVASITRTATSHGPFFDDDLHRSVDGGRDADEATRYLNIWVADIATLLGYASSPGSAEFKDGVALNYKYIGRTQDINTPYNGGRTLTHEIGHWLGLQHLWGIGDCEVNDGLADTPAQDEAVGGCSLDHVSCGNLNMTQNFMNLADDACMNLFTREQSALMRQILLTQRSDSYTTGRLITGLDRNPEISSVDIYPNPASNGELSVRTKDENAQISVIDLTGKTIRKQNINGRNEITVINLSEYPRGLYMISIQSPDRIYNRKIYLDN